MKSINLKSFVISFALIFTAFVIINIIIFHALFGIESFMILGSDISGDDYVPTSIVLSSEGQVQIADEVDLEDTFTRSSTNAWDREWGSFRIISFEDSRVWSSYGTAETYRESSETWQDFTTQINFYVDDFQNGGTVNFKIRRPTADACGHYTLTFGASHMGLSRQASDCTTVEQFLYEDINLATNTWHQLYIQVEDTTLRWQLDDELVYEMNDILYTQGGLGILNYQLGSVFIDNIQTTFP